MLNYQKDSLQNLLLRNKESYQNEINKLNFDIKSSESQVKKLSQSNENLIKENTSLKTQVVELKNKLDSISNSKFGELLLPKVDTDAANDDCIYNYYFNKSTIELPENNVEFGAGGISMVEILPIGWSHEGVFAYNWVSRDVCGMCSAGLSLFDARTNTELPSHNYNLELTGELGEKSSRCNILKDINADKEKEFSYHNITPISDLKMKFIKSSDGALFVENRKFKIENSNSKGRLISIDQVGERKILHEEKLKKEYNSEYEQWCEDYIQINGCFYNPLDSRQLVIHLYYIVPCGFEHENEHSSFFVSINL